MQRQLPGRQLLTVGYVGSKGTNIDSTIELNNPDPAIDTATSTTQTRRPFQFVIDGPGGPKRPVTRIRFLTNGSNSWYHGLQVNYEKRMSKGLQFGVAYTYSQSLGEGYGRTEAFGGTTNNTQDPRNRAAGKGRYPFDVRHNMVANFIYEIPTFAGMKSGIARSGKLSRAPNTTVCRECRGSSGLRAMPDNAVRSSTMYTGSPSASSTTGKAK